MSLKIHRVQNHNTPVGEAVIMYAEADLNLKNYAVVDKTFDADGIVSNEFRHIFFFPKQEVKKGEWIVLISGTGTNGTKGKFNDDNDLYYRFYWESKSCIWNDGGGDTASVIEYASIDKKSVPKFVAPQ